MNKQYQLTKEKLEEFKQELKTLKEKKLQELDDVLVSIQDENIGELESPFYELNKDKFYLEKRIEELNTIINNAKIIKNNRKHKKVEIGATVKVGFDTCEETYQLVSPLEANPLEGKISIESPVGKALLGCKIGDKTKVKLGGIFKEFRILNIN